MRKRRDTGEDWLTMGEASGEAAAIGGDPRLEFMGQYVCRRLKLKPEKWARTSTQEEHKNTFKDFLDGDQQMQLIVVLTPSAQLLPLVNFPLSQLKTKGNFRVRDKIDGILNEKFSICI